MSHDPYKALYIHIPFCKKRCDYCDFATDAVEKDSHIIRNYIDDLIFQIRDRSAEGELEEIETIYIGGGTPTHIGHDKLCELIYLISTTVDLRGVSEFCIEANPESLTENIVSDISSLGINRISIGVQSFNDKYLKTLGRIHDSQSAVNAIDCALKYIENVSIDLMCGLPSQNLSDWTNDVNTACNLGISHISIYPLTIEPKTKFWKLMRRGKLKLPDEDMQADMMEIAQSILEEHDFHRYEVANYAKCGFESKHNLAYWKSLPYLGIGRSAATMTQNDSRRMRIVDGNVSDDLSRKEMEAEDIMLLMRLKSGVSDEKCEIASKYLPNLMNALEDLQNKGLIKDECNAYIPTSKGWLCGNELYMKILSLGQEKS